MREPTYHHFHFNLGSRVLESKKRKCWNGLWSMCSIMEGFLEVGRLSNWYSGTFSSLWLEPFGGVSEEEGLFNVKGREFSMAGYLNTGCSLGNTLGINTRGRQGEQAGRVQLPWSNKVTLSRHFQWQELGNINIYAFFYKDKIHHEFIHNTSNSISGLQGFI